MEAFPHLAGHVVRDTANVATSFPGFGTLAKAAGLSIEERVQA